MNGLQVKEDKERKGRAIMDMSVAHYGVDLETLGLKEKGDMKRVSVAWVIKRETTLSQSWVAEVLGMKSAANVSQQVGRFKKCRKRG